MQSWMAVCLDFTLQMMMRRIGWQTLEGEPAYEKVSSWHGIAL